MSPIDGGSLFVLPRPLEVGVGNRVAVRVVRRKAERPVDPRFELLRDHVLEAVGLVVDRVDVQPERLGEVELEQAVMADHLERDSLAVGCQTGAPVPLVLEELQRGELLDHCRRRRGRHRLILCDRTDRHTPVLGLELVDALQVVLDRLGETGLAHREQGNVAAVPIRVGHSADPDDAFMAWAFEVGKVDTRGLEFELVASDIETLNQWALAGRLEVTALSAGAYPAVAAEYLLLPHGASFGEGYGPIVVSREPLSLEELREVEIATPGALTTASRVLGRALGEIATRDLPFDAILDEVLSGRARAGVLIHEGQLTYAEHGLHKVLDLGVWWRDETGLPLPLGVVVARRDLERPADVSAVVREAIEVGLANRDEAMKYAMAFGRGIDAATADEFVAMYVNDLTLDMGERGREAIALLLGSEPDFSD
jgi:1,4-dihydroxy-6-naphthoate synthase